MNADPAVKPPDKHSFSVTQIAVTALIGFGISGLGGAALNSYLARPKIQLFVEAVGFQAPDNASVATVPDSLRELSQSSPWMRDLDAQESVRDLFNALQDVRTTSERISKAMDQTDSWLQQVQSRNLVEETNQLAEYDIEDTPLFSDIVSSSLGGDARRNSLPPPPMSMSDLLKLQPLLKTSTDSDGKLWVESNKFRMTFGAGSNEDVKLLTESLSRGCIRNLVFYARFFLHESKKERASLIAAQTGLSSLIGSISSFAVRITALNSGQTAVTLGPAFAVQVSSAGKTSALQLVVGPAQDAHHLFGSLSDLAMGQDTSGASHGFITLGPNTAQRATLVSTHHLSFSDPTVKAILDCSGDCTARIAGTEGTRVIVSARIGFSATFIAAEQERAADALKQGV